MWYLMFSLEYLHYLLYVFTLMECIRFTHDEHLYWSIYLCPILFDNCEIVNCNTCLQQSTPFSMYRDILIEYFNGAHLVIIDLLISYACTYQVCKTCNKKESNIQHHIRCHICKTTYYCDKLCRLNDWTQNHKFVCGKYHIKY